VHRIGSHLPSSRTWRRRIADPNPLVRSFPERCRRLAALARLIPPPRVHLLRYRGVLAPNAGLRDRVSPSVASSRPPHHRPAEPIPPAPELRPLRLGAPSRSHLRGLPAALHCLRRRDAHSRFPDRFTFAGILPHLGLPATAPPLTPARSSPPEDPGFDAEHILDPDPAPAFDSIDPDPLPDYDSDQTHGAPRRPRAKLRQRDASRPLRQRPVPTSAVVSASRRGLRDPPAKNRSRTSHLFQQPRLHIAPLTLAPAAGILPQEPKPSRKALGNSFPLLGAGPSFGSGGSGSSPLRYALARARTCGRPDLTAGSEPQADGQRRHVTRRRVVHGLRARRRCRATDSLPGPLPSPTCPSPPYFRPSATARRILGTTLNGTAPAVIWLTAPARYRSGSGA
jgi:hypothetical protein